MLKMNRFFLITLIVIFIFNIAPLNVSANDEYYVAEVGEGKKEIIESFNDYYLANSFYLRNIDNYDNLVLYHDEEVLKMEYGIVEFVSNDACSLNLKYRSTIKNKSSSINACYGIDGAYLYSNNDASIVYFKYAGDIGYIDKEDVILHPYDLLDVRLSSYSNIDGSLNHKIKTQLLLDYYAYALELDDSLAFLKDNKDYYSYDGHFFYDDFYKMIDDYKNDEYENAINKDAYYNYYLYLPARSLTNYEYQEIEDYFYKTLKINGKIDYYDDQAKDNANDVVNKSQYYGELQSFFEYQYLYGVNALSALSVSIHESAYGKSFKAYSENNIFSNAAYDSQEERKNNHYSSISDSIYSYMKYYVSDRYCNYRNSFYNGSYFGNKLSGMNVEYSLDAYWGEKAAANYYKLDKALGYKDYNSYAIGVIEEEEKVIFYNDLDLSRSKFTLNNLNAYSLIILEELEDVYKVQIDPSFSSDYLYDYDNCVAYVKKDNFDYLINSDKIHQNDLVTITFDGNGGLYEGNKKLKIKVLKGSVPVINNPNYDSYIFVGYDEEIIPAEQEKTYVANYQKIEKINLNKNIKKELELGTYFDLRDIYLNVVYENGHKEKVPLNSNMLGGVNINEDGKQNLLITYNGLSINEDINVSKSLKELNEKTDSLIEKNLESYLNEGKYDLDEIKEIRSNLNKINYSYDFNEIRAIDLIIHESGLDDNHYHIDDNDYDLSISGLSLSLAPSNKFFLFKGLHDTYYVSIKQLNKKEKILKEIGEAYGFEAIDYFEISFSLNLKKTDVQGTFVASIKIDDKQNDKTYSIYRLDENGDVVKCRTSQSNNYIQFISKKAGKFIVLAKDSVNNYIIEDYIENINASNSVADNQDYFLIGTIGLITILYGLVMVIMNMNLERLKEKTWKDYKKLLQKAVIVQEEKPKN